MSSPLPKNLIEKLKNRKARIGVSGLGYVGLPLAVEYAKVGFRVTGIDVAAGRVASLNKGKSYIPDVCEEEVRDLVKQGRLKATKNFDALK